MAMFKNSTYLLSILATLAALLANPVIGQTQGGNTATTSSEASDQLVEIIVTAQKHEESAERTAISMSVYGGDDLRASGVNNIQSLTRIDPSINFSTATGGAYIAVSSR